MIDKKHTKPVLRLGSKQRRDTGAKSWRTGLLIIGFMLTVGLSYLAGTLNTSLKQAIVGDSFDTSSIQATYEALKSKYDGDLDDQVLIDGANRGLVEAVGDDYTVYMDAEETQSFNDSLSGEIGGGIGVEIGTRNDQPTIVRVLRDNPAEKVGIMTGDVIMAVNGESVVENTTSEIASKIRGDIGTTVKITVYRDGETKDFSITRDNVDNPSVYYSIDDDIGIITITRFDNDTGSLTREAAEEMKSKDVEGVILDLRGNGGGYVDAAEQVASVWLNNKLVVTEKSGSSVVDEIKSDSDPILEGVPTVVLVNGSSASASEIVAGALQDYDVAEIVGETTYGKGSVQQLLSLPNDASLKVTVARWYTPNGVNISEKGITPDVEVERTGDDVNAGKDPQLDAAKLVLNK